MSRTIRLGFALVIVAIWVLMLSILTLPANALGWPSARSRYIRQVYHDINSYGLILGAYAKHPPAGSTGQEDAMYVIRGEADIVIVEEKLARYAKRDAERADVEDALRQLARDIEDVPAENEQNRSKI